VNISGKKILMSVCVVGVAISLWLIVEKRLTPSAGSIAGGGRVATPILKQISQATRERSKALRTVVPNSSAEAKRAMAFLNHWMEDEVFRAFFDYTLGFFGNTPGAYAAARFVSLTLIFDESSENFYLMGWTQKELKQNSENLMRVIELKKDSINENPYFHSRMLNLVNQLELPAPRKIAFYGETINAPLKLEANGEVSEGSLAIETALFLAAAAAKSETDVAPVISRAIASGKYSTKEMAAFKERVVGVFPGLGYLFD